MENPYRVLKQEQPSQEKGFQLKVYDLFFAMVISSTIDRILYENAPEYVSTKVFLCWVVGMVLLVISKRRYE